MIIDHLTHAARYLTVLDGLAPAFDFLRRPDLAALPDGRHELDGSRVYALLQSYTTRPRELGKPEAHRRYVDIQCLLAGREVCGIVHLRDDLGVDTPYNAERDFMFLRPTPCDFVTLQPGTFAIFFPWDAHQPGCQAGDAPEAVRKVVIKIALPER